MSQTSLEKKIYSNCFANLTTIISILVLPCTLAPHLIVIDYVTCCWELWATFHNVYFLMNFFLLYFCGSTGNQCPSRRSYNWCFMWVFAADVVTALDQGLSALGCRNNPLIVPLNRKWVGRKGAVGEAVQWVHSSGGRESVCERERERERGRRQRERK